MTVDNLIWLVIGCVIGGGITLGAVLAFAWYVWRCADEDRDLGGDGRRRK